MEVSSASHPYSVLRDKTMNSSKGHQTMKNFKCPIKILPQNLQFVNVEINQKYQMQIVLRNQGKESEKIRVICPNSLFFTVKLQANPFTIAPGLSVKLPVFFYLKGIYDCSSQFYEDKVTIIGSNFKKQLQLKSFKPNYKLVVPQIFNLGLLTIGREKKFTISLKNQGKQDVEVALIQSSSPTVSILDQKLLIKKQSQTQFKIKVLRQNAGLIEELLYFPNGEIIKLKGVCQDESVQIYNKNGQILKSHNFGIIYTGQKIVYPFYIANNSTSKIDGLAKVFEKNVAEYSNLKVDVNKMTFINRTNPKKYLQQQKQVTTKCLLKKFSVNPYQDLQNKLTIMKQPTEEQLKKFSEISLQKNDKQNKQTGWNALTQICQVLFIKFFNLENPIKIPIQFVPIIPKISISQDKFQFLSVKVKQESRISFTVRNCNERAITIKLQNGNIFYFQGDSTIKPFQTKEYFVCFRPLIPGDYSEQLKLTIFDVWSVTLKIYGECCMKSNLFDKQNFNLSLSKNSSIGNFNSTRYLSQQRKKRKLNENTKYLQNKLTERVMMGYLKKSGEEPNDLAFDAGQNPKVVPNKKFVIKYKTEGLFFNKEQYSRTFAQKNKVGSLSTRINVKQIIKCSEELTQIQLSKVEVKCDRLDFGNVFVGSLSQKQLIITNKNSKPILFELDLNSQYLKQTKEEVKKIEPFCESKFVIKLKPMHLGNIKIPLCYIINKQHVFEIDAIANVTLINLGFSKNLLEFNFGLNDHNLEKVQDLIVTNYGNTNTKFSIIEPANKAFIVVSNKEQEVLPNSSSTISVKYSPLEGTQSGQMRIDSDKLIVKILGGAQNIIKCEGTVFQPKYSIKQSQINISEVFISKSYHNKITIRNHSKNQTAIKVQLNPPSLCQIINLDQRNFVLSSEQRKQLNFSLLSHDVKVVKGAFIISARGGKTYKIPIYINFCFPTVEVVGCNQVDLGTIHIMTNHFQRQITLINRTKTQIKLETESGDYSKMDYIIEFIATQERVQLAIRQTIGDSEKDQSQLRLSKKRQILVQDKLNSNTTQIKNPKNVSKIITLAPGIETKFKLRFIPKVVKQYQIKIPLYLHKATRQIQPIPQKIKCKAVEPLFYINPYSITFNNVIITQNQSAYKKQFQIINPHDREVDWQVLESSNSNISKLFKFQQMSGRLKPKQSKKISLYFCPNKQGVYSQKIKLFSSLDKQIMVELQINGNAESPRLSFNKNLLILPVVPIKTQSKGVIFIQNNGYEAVTINKVKFSHNFEDVDLKYTFLDGKLLSLAKKKLKIQISFTSNIPISLTTHFQIFDQYGYKISIPISATSDNCILTTYPYLELVNSTVVFDGPQNMLKLLIKKTFTSKKQTNISGSSAVSSNFIKKWCNYELNININNFPDGFVESKGELLYELIVKMTNGRPIVKKPSIMSQQKVTKMLELHQYYTDVIKALQVEGAFLNHIRPQNLLNMNDYILFMCHKGYVIQEDEFQCASHDSWTVMFYQLCKLYIEPTINEKFIQKFNFKHKIDKSINSLIYSQPEVLILGFINQFLGEEKVFSLSDQPKLFEAIQRIIQKNFKINLSEELSKLKINADSLMLHQFMMLVSKFLYTYLQQFGLSMYLQPNDLFTIGYKQFVLFFISLMQNLLNFQNSCIVQFQSATGQRNEKVIQLQNPSKKKKLKYWVKIYGSNNFKSSQKEIQIQPQQIKILRISYHCKKNSNQQGQLILVPVKGEDYFSSAQPLKFALKNILIQKTVMKRTTIKVHLYEVKSISCDVQIPTIQQICQYDIKLQQTQKNLHQYPNFYLLQSGKRLIRNGKDKCQIKIACLQMGQFTFKVVFTSQKFQEYIYQFSVSVALPNISHSFKLQPITTQKQQLIWIKIPIQNELKQQCMKFHRQTAKQLAKQKEKQKKTQTVVQATNKIMSFANKNKSKTRIPTKNKYQLQFVEQSVFILPCDTLQLNKDHKDHKDHKDREKEKEKERTEQSHINMNFYNTGNKVAIQAYFMKPYREYRSLLAVKNFQLGDYRVYQLLTTVSIRPKTFNIKLSTKARQVVKTTIPNKMSPFNFRLQKNIPQLKIEFSESSQLVATFSPSWVVKQDIDLYIESPQTFQQHIYKIKLEAKLPDPIKTITVTASQLFPTPFEIDISSLKLSHKEMQQIKIKSQIRRNHQVSIKNQENNQKIVGLLYPSQEEQMSSIKLILVKNQHYYEYVLNIKCNQVIDMGLFNLNQDIGQSKKFIFQGINTETKDFHYEYSHENFITHQFLPHNSPKNKQSNFVITFKPIKQTQCEKLFKFRSNGKQYMSKILFHTKKLQETLVPIFITENLQKKMYPVLITNIYDEDGFYEVHIEDPIRFKVECHSFEIKNKQKVQLKISFTPKFIGDTCKSKIVLKSAILPELVYLVQGISKFKCKKIQQQVQGYQGVQATKQLTFCNQFNQKQRFRFQLSSSIFTFGQKGSFFIKDIEPEQSFSFTISNKCFSLNQDSKEQNKISVIRLSNRKIIKQYILNLSIVKMLEDKKYTWQCKARQTIFETIRLPNSYSLKQIKTEHEIEKYISFNIDQKNLYQAKIKFTPLKPIRNKVFSILLICEKIKFRILCQVKVTLPAIDDVISIKTSDIKETGIAVFKLTNIARQPAIYKAYFQKSLQQLEVEPAHGTLQPYGKAGTNITVKFCSDIHNKRVEDKLVVETEGMYWLFKVIGAQQKVLNY